jgi:hypothetical protein
MSDGKDLKRYLVFLMLREVTHCLSWEFKHHLPYYHQDSFLRFHWGDVGIVIRRCDPASEHSSPGLS